MNGKIVALIAFVCLAVAGWLFYYNQPKPTVVSAPKADIKSQISDIRASQTNPDTGQIEYTLTAKTLTQDNNGQNVLSDIMLVWTPSQTQTYQMTSSTANLDETTGDMLLKDGFTFLTQSQDSVPIKITGGVLTGNTKTRQIKSDDMLEVHQGDNFFYAKGMTADLNAGEYAFFGVTAEFTAPKRTDKPLF